MVRFFGVDFCDRVDDGSGAGQTTCYGLGGETRSQGDFSFTYDAAQRVHRIAETATGREVTRFEYDVASGVRRELVESGYDVTRVIDEFGDVSEMTRGVAALLQFEYDKLGRPVDEHYSFGSGGGGSFHTSRHYIGNGNHGAGSLGGSSHGSFTEVIDYGLHGPTRVHQRLNYGGATLIDEERLRYDSYGRVEAITKPSLGAAGVPDLQIVYSPDGMIESIKNSAVSTFDSNAAIIDGIAYDESREMSFAELPGGLCLEVDRDASTGKEASRRLFECSTGNVVVSEALSFAPGSGTVSRSRLAPGGPDRSVVSAARLNKRTLQDREASALGAPDFLQEECPTCPLIEDFDVGPASWFSRDGSLTYVDSAISGSSTDPAFRMSVEGDIEAKGGAYHLQYYGMGFAAGGTVIGQQFRLEYGPSMERMGYQLGSLFVGNLGRLKPFYELNGLRVEEVLLWEVGGVSVSARIVLNGGLLASKLYRIRFFDYRQALVMTLDVDVGGSSPWVVNRIDASPLGAFSVQPDPLDPVIEGTYHYVGGGLYTSPGRLFDSALGVFTSPDIVSVGPDAVDAAERNRYILKMHQFDGKAFDSSGWCVSGIFNGTVRVHCPEPGGNIPEAQLREELTRLVQLDLLAESARLVWCS